MVLLNPSSLRSVVNDYYHQQAESQFGERFGEKVGSVNPPDVYAMRKVSSLREGGLQRLESLGIRDKIRQPVLIHKKWGAAAGVSSLLASDKVSFKADGPDDMASLAKETVEGVAQPLTHLGVLGLFYPFVAMGASGLSEDYLDAKVTLNEVKEALQAERQALSEVGQCLQDQGMSPDVFQLQGRHSIRKNVALLQKAIQLGASDVNQSHDTSMNLAKALKSTLAIGVLQERQQHIQQDKRESWCAAKGMKGMQRAMQLFILEAASSLCTFMTAGRASSVFATVATGVGTIGTGVMGAGQLLMMISGLYKSKAGVSGWRDMRAQIGKDKQRLEQIKTPTVRTALQQKIQDQSAQSKTRLMQHLVPGASLATGQALMFSWSAASLTFLFSGVAAPLGLGMMLALLIPGVGLTLAASLPKIGLEAKYDDQIEEQFGAHGEDEGFDEIEYIQNLPTTIEALADHANALQKLLESVDESELSEFAEMKEGESYDQKISTKTRFDGLYDTLSKIDQLEEFGAQVAALHHGKTLFRTDNVHEYKPVHAWHSVKNIKNPLAIRHSNLFNKGKERLETTTFYHFEPDRVERSPLRDQVMSVGLGLVRQFSKERLRAELQATQKVMDLGSV